MAENEGAAQDGHDEQILTLVGPSNSGKTVLISALLSNEAEAAEVAANATAVGAAGAAPEALWITKGHLTDVETSELLHRVNESVAKSKSFLNDATTEPYSFDAVITWKEADVGGGNQDSFHRAVFRLWDGPGGLFTRFIDSEDNAGEHQARTDYRDLFRRSNGTVICLSASDEDFNLDQMRRLEDEFSILAQRKRDEPDQGLRNVALCFTKIETRLLKYGSLAYRHLLDHPEDVIPAQRYQDVVTILNNMQQEFDQLTVRVFPVSTYGFVGGTGVPNFLPHPEQPGLLTRMITDDMLDEDDGSGSGTVWRDYFPAQIDDPTNEELWRPFNLAPAFFFAATGRATGPLSLPIEDVYRQITQ